jgi:hypothetical protein
VRFARDFGTVRELLPDGITRLVDAPWRLFDAIYRAIAILGFEQLPRDEQPPEAIWLDNRALRDWFKAVDAKREREADPNKQIEDPVQNDAASALIHG